jgi:hypothetical protein
MSEYTRRIAWVKRKLNAGEPITGELLDFALEQVPNPGPNPSKSEEIWVSIANKIRTGEKLGDYELHLMVDVILLHARLGAASQDSDKDEESGEPSFV